MFRAGLGCCALLLSLSTIALAADDLPSAAKTKVDYARDIEPLLARRCYVCHGPQQQMSGLRLDRKDAALQVIQPGNSAASRLIRMVAGVEKKVMPPVGARLTAAEIGLLDRKSVV
jgi:mono/diheme cytochrome c family protein